MTDRPARPEGHPSNCVCVPCCDARGGRRGAADIERIRVNVWWHWWEKGQGLDSAMRSAGMRTTLLVWVMLPLAVIGLLLIASGR